jgi:hypothetical protein
MQPIAGSVCLNLHDVEVTSYWLRLFHRYRPWVHDAVKQQPFEVPVLASIGNTMMHADQPLADNCSTAEKPLSVLSISWQNRAEHSTSFGC